MRPAGLGQKQGERVAPDHEAGMISPKTRMSSPWSGGQPSADADLLSRWCEGDAVALCFTEPGAFVRARLKNFNNLEDEYQRLYY